MRTARTRLAFSVLIVIAMISSGLGVSSIMLSKGTAPAVSGQTGTMGTRTDGTPTAVSLAGTNLNEVQADNLPTQTPTSASQNTKPVTEQIGHDDVKQANENMRVSGSHIEKTVINTETGTRNPFFDAGGPYGGPNCFEGSCMIHFEITTDDPTLIFFRWDFNNDGVWDTPWLTDMFYDLTFDDNFFGEIKAEGWDGISTTTYVITGNNLNEGTNPYWYLWPLNTGWKFRAKVSMDATALGVYVYWTSYPGYELRLWDWTTKAMLGMCTPAVQNTYSWNWCTLASPVHFTLGKEYMISEHMDYDYGYYVGMNNPPVLWEKVEFQDFWYAWSLPKRIPEYDNGGGTTYVPMIDFQWRQVVVIPLTQQDTASLDVNNVAPQPYGIETNPSPALEGTPVKMSAWFDDPGTLDTWKYRWYFGDGTWSPWMDVKKYAGGATVLFYHSVTGDIDTFLPKIKDACGPFCIKIDAYDFGPLGQNKWMTLDQLLAYDVIWVDTNWGYIPTPDEGGNQLADYMDQKGDQGSGGIVMGNGAFIANSPWDIRGRYFSDEYSPIVKTSYSFGNWNLGTIYVPGHPILDGVTTLTSYMHLNAASLTTGATRVADWNTGYIAVATKPNPIVNNGAMSVALPWSAWYNCGGDCVKITVNAIRYASRQPDPTLLPMPIQLPWTSHIYKDDDPVTTSPQDDIQLKVEVKDDDHLKVEGTTTLFAGEDFTNDCNYYTFPTGWENDPYYGWQCYYDYNLGSNAANVWYYDNDYSTSLLSTPIYDLSAYNAGKIEWKQYWWADYGGAFQDGYVEVSTDGGMTYPDIVAEFHHGSPGQETAVHIADIPFVSDQVRVRFRFESGYDWCWIVDDVKIYGLQGRLVWGLGEAWGTATIANVPPTIVGGPTSGLRDEAQDFDIAGMAISDPAILEPTEWFAYKVDYDDGTPSEWVYKGTLAPPKQDILFIHSQCYPGNGCGELMNVINMLNSMDLVGSVTPYNFFDTLSAPSLSYMEQFDVIMFATNWAYLGYPPYDAARVVIGNNMADYLDDHAGGVVTMMATYDLSPYYGDIFTLLGRYIDQDYGPFEKEIYSFGNAYFPPTIHYPDHPVMKGVGRVESNVIYSGDQKTTPGGIRLASWNSGGAAVGVKDFNEDGRRSCAINTYTGGYAGAGAPTLLRNCIGWAIGGIPTADIPPVMHTWGDNGKYTLGMTLIDDDMGWTWDAVNDVPVADPMYQQSLSFYNVPFEVYNVDPTIHSAAAYTMVDLCIRLSGNKGNDATLTVMGSDGSYYTVTTTRVPGQPNIGCLPTIKVDMTPSTQYTFTIAYDPTGDSGANPEWIFSGEFPDGKIKELRHTFNSNDGPSVWTIGNKEFKALAIGSPLTFEALASDPGSDDLAFAWVWSDSTPYDIHIYAHPGIFYTSASSDKLNKLPFEEPTFIFADNSVRSPSVDPMRAHDTATHQFSSAQMPYFLYVTLIVADDDNGNPYSSPYLWPGMDVEIVQIDI